MSNVEATHPDIDIIDIDINIDIGKNKENLFQTWIDGLVCSTLLRVESF